MGQTSHQTEFQHPDGANPINQSVAESTETTAAPDSLQALSTPRRFPLGRFLLLSSAFVITAGVSATLGALAVLTTPLNSAIAPYGQVEPLSLGEVWQRGLGYQVTRPVNILVMGLDRDLDAPENSPDVFSGRSDTMLLVRIDPAADTVNVLSIPRDTRVRIPGEGIAKINHANVVGGAPLAARVVSRTLNDIPVDRYVRISTDAFREMVDLLGGIEIFVPNDMQYTDNTQDLHIDLKQGWQTLNGDQAEQFARFRYDAYGDVGRVQRQQQLLKALRDRLTSPAVLPKLPQIIALMEKYIDTNLSLDEMLSLVGFGLNLEQDSFRMVLLPGRFSTPQEFIASYWILDPDARDQVMEQYFNVSPIGVASYQPRTANRLKIAIQNASGEPNLSREVVQYLREQGFTNVYTIRDWPDPQLQTQIIVQRGNLSGAQTLENVLDMGRVVADSTGDLESDLTIRIGADWSERHKRGSL